MKILKEIRLLRENKKNFLESKNIVFTWILTLLFILLLIKFFFFFFFSVSFDGFLSSPKAQTFFFFI